MIQLLAGDARDVLPTLEAESFAACVTDPPYHLTNNTGTRSPYPGQYTPIGRPKEPKGGFMGKQWDGGSVAFHPETWVAVLRVLKPGAHMLCFGGTRTHHRLACAIEDAGFEIRDTLCWLYGSGFPKSLDVSKAIDRAAGAEREVVGLRQFADGTTARATAGVSHEVYGDFAGAPLVTAPATPAAQRWNGWGTALKPAYEPIILARKPLIGTVVANVLAHGTGALNIDASRVATGDDLNGGTYSGELRDPGPQRCLENRNRKRGIGEFVQPFGRWPANVIHDGSDEVEAAFAMFETHSAGAARDKLVTTDYAATSYDMSGTTNMRRFGDTGTASRFFYCAKADAADRADSRHPTIKPVDLIRYLVQLITPPGGHILDPFAGSGTTGEAAMLLGHDCTLIEQDAQHVADIEHRRKRWSGGDLPLFTSFPPASDDTYDSGMRDLFRDAAD